MKTLLGILGGLAIVGLLGFGAWKSGVLDKFLRKGSAENAQSVPMGDSKLVVTTTGNTGVRIVADVGCNQCPPLAEPAKQSSDSSSTTTAPPKESDTSKLEVESVNNTGAHVEGDVGCNDCPKESPRPKPVSKPTARKAPAPCPPCPNCPERPTSDLRRSTYVEEIEEAEPVHLRTSHMAIDIGRDGESGVTFRPR